MSRQARKCLHRPTSDFYRFSDDAVLVADGHSLVVGYHGSVILSVCQYHALRVAGSAGRVEDVAYIFFVGLLVERLHFSLARQSLTEFEEVVKVEGCRVVRADSHAAVEDDDALQRMAEREYAVCLVVLLLLADKEEANLRIVNHILYLLFGRGSVERYGHDTHAVGTEVGDEVLDAVLREHADGVLRLSSEIEEGIAGLLHKSGEATIAHGLPYRTAEILIREGFALSILLCLLKGEN